MGSRFRISALLGAIAASLSLASSADAVTYANPSRIAIDDNTPATPYPSPITVSGMNGTVTDLKLTVRGLTHTFLDDVGIVLESPTGETLMLMDGIGPKSNPSPNAGVSAIDLTFDDAAPTQLQDGTVPTSGSFRPANYYPETGSDLDNFPAPGPGGTYGNPGPAASGSATFVQSTSGVFDGISANGTWQLFVRDFSAQDRGEIGRGWALDVETTLGGGDITPPDTTITSGPSGTIDQTSVSFSFTSTEPGAFECKLDDEAFTSCDTPQPYSNLTEGPHTFSVRALDFAALVDPTPASRSFTVALVVPPPPPPPPPPPDPTPGSDTRAPEVSITKLAVNKKKRTAVLEFTGADDVTPAFALTFACKLDGKPAAPCTSPTAYRKLKAGPHLIEVRAADAAGNESVPATKSFRVKKP